MRKALKGLRNISQGKTDVEEENQKGLNQAIFRCGNVHVDDKTITLYIEGLALSDIIRVMVARYHESLHHR